MKSWLNNLDSWHCSCWNCSCIVRILHWVCTLGHKHQIYFDNLMKVCWDTIHISCCNFYYVWIHFKNQVCSSLELFQRKTVVARPIALCRIHRLVCYNHFRIANQGCWWTVNDDKKNSQVCFRQFCHSFFSRCQRCTVNYIFWRKGCDDRHRDWE